MTTLIKALIFDMGGVILRTQDHAPRELMAKRFHTSRRELEDYVFMSPSSLLSEVGKKSNYEHWQTVLDNFNVDGVNPETAYRDFFSGDVVNSELLDYIDFLRPDYRIGLLSNAWSNARENLSKMFEFLEHFEVSIFSSELGVRKPDPEIFYEFLRRLDVKAEESIFIDDFKENIKGAKAVGLHAILFKNNPSAVLAINNLLG